MSSDEGPDDMERELMKKNDFGALQQHRLERYTHLKRPSDVEHDHHYMGVLVDTEQSMRQIVQKEESHRQTIKSNEKKNPPSTWERLNENLHYSLNNLAREYWILEQKWWRTWREIDETGGYLTRAFQLWRSYPQWYLHRVLREDCAMRDGCCSRGCGCCAKRATEDPYTSTRKLGIGHCTVDCACCASARGFCLGGDEHSRASQHSRISGPYEDSRYASKIRDASIWGVLSGDSGHPSDQINDRPPAYTPKAVFQSPILELDKLII